MEFQYMVVRKHDAVVAATGRTVHAALDASGKPCRLPARVREAFA
jgi:acyl-CoA thioesterase FadM